jgi:hypothetical protein
MQTQTITIHVAPNIVIQASEDAKSKEIAREVQQEILYSIRYDGKFRKEIKDLVRYG